MKPLYLLLITAISCFSVTAVAQSDKKTDFNFFGKGMNSYAIRENFYYGQMKITDNGVDRGKTNDTYVDLDWKHWIGKGFGVGLKLDADWYGNHPGNVDHLTRDWSISPELSWGTMFSDRFGGYITGNVLFGQNKNVFKTGSNSTSDKSDLSGYGASLAFPYKFSSYSAITLQLGYDYQQEKNDDSRIKESNFGVNVFLQDFLLCKQIKCDHSTKWKLSAHAYDQGSGFLLSETQLGFNTGNSKLKLNNSTNTSETKYTNGTVDLKGSYYIINYLGVGAGLEYDHSTNKVSAGSYNSTNNSFQFSPEVYIHLPAGNGWRNLFAKGGGYFGSENDEYTLGASTFKSKTGTSGYNVGIGYNFFFAEHTAIQTCIYYRSVTFKDKDTDDESKQHGPAVSIGLAHTFGRVNY